MRGLILRVDMKKTPRLVFITVNTLSCMNDATIFVTVSAVHVAMGLKVFQAFSVQFSSGYRLISHAPASTGLSRGRTILFSCLFTDISASVVVIGDLGPVGALPWVLWARCPESCRRATLGPVGALP